MGGSWAGGGGITVYSRMAKKKKRKKMCAKWGEVVIFNMFCLGWGCFFLGVGAIFNQHRMTVREDTFYWKWGYGEWGPEWQ